MADQTNLKPPAPSWKLILGTIAGGLVAVWLFIRVLSALAALVKLVIIIAVVVAIASFVMKQIEESKHK
jgi:predicted lipid-binding transport protein (Tim44 family)